MAVQRRHTILLVEDSVEDAEATIRAFRKAKLCNGIHHCSDGDEALDYLHRRGRFGAPGAAPRPELILLDLNLPGSDGREVLREIKAAPDLKSIPVIVLTTSADERDIENCYLTGANTYVQKPLSLQGFLEAIQRLTDFWFEIVILPRSEAA
jgi:CheY-like chemotaxis protein